MKIEIPFKTPSINHLYAQRGWRKFLTKEAKELKKEIHKLIPKDTLDKKSKLRVIVEIYEDWYTKKGDIKRVDISNREKFLIDSIFDKLKVDDKQIFDHTMRKIQSDEEKAVVTIIELK
ncbi:MAG: RusA family crossover junction endodeoxyribonuclease [Candidatus Woesearchaeota archaeon]